MNSKLWILWLCGGWHVFVALQGSWVQCLWIGQLGFWLTFSRRSIKSVFQLRRNQTSQPPWEGTSVDPQIQGEQWSFRQFSTRLTFCPPEHIGGSVGVCLSSLEVCGGLWRVWKSYCFKYRNLSILESCLWVREEWCGRFGIRVKLPIYFPILSKCLPGGWKMDEWMLATILIHSTIWAN